MTLPTPQQPAAPVGQVTVDLTSLNILMTTMVKRTSNFTVPLGRINASLSRFFREQFDTRGVAGGERWQAISSFTSRLRQRPGHGRGGPTAPLWDTGRLRAAYVKGVGPESIKVITPTSLTRGVTVPYALFHQQGFEVRSVFGHKLAEPRHVVPRKVIPEDVPERLVEEWHGILVDYLNGVPQGGGSE